MMRIRMRIFLCGSGSVFSFDADPDADFYFLMLMRIRILKAASQSFFLCIISSVVDPHRSALILLSCIRILIGNADPDPGAWKLTKIKK
jgi:hypothetical protein